VETISSLVKLLIFFQWPHRARACRGGDGTPAGRTRVAAPTGSGAEGGEVMDPWPCGEDAAMTPPLYSYLMA